MGYRRARHDYQKECPKCGTMVYRFTDGTCGPCARGKDRPLVPGTVLYDTNGKEATIRAKVRGGYTTSGYRTVRPDQIAKTWSPAVSDSALYYLDPAAAEEAGYYELLRSQKQAVSSYRYYTKYADEQRTKFDRIAAKIQHTNPDLDQRVREKWTAHCAGRRLQGSFTDEQFQTAMTELEPVYLEEPVYIDEIPDWVEKALPTEQKFDGVCIG